MRESAAARIAALPVGGGKEDFAVEKSRSGLPIARIGSSTLDSRYDPLGEARRRAAAPALAGKSTVILIGDGFYYLATLLARQGIAVYVLEPDPVLARAALAARGAGELDGFPLAFADELPDLESLAAFLPAGVSPLAIAVLEHAHAAVRFPAVVARLRQLVREWLARLVAELETTAWFGRRWLANILDNLAILPERPIGLPGGPTLAVIAVPGSSLDAALGELTRYRERILLVALAPAVRRLLAADLLPDLVCSMDGGWANALHLAGLDLPATPLCFALYANAAQVAAWSGPLVPVSLGLPIESRLGTAAAFPLFRETPTVAGFALQAARCCGATQVVLAGQDFASRGYRQHCLEYRFDQDRETRDSRIDNARRRQAAPYRLDARSRDGREVRDGFRADRKLSWYAGDFSRQAGPGVSLLTPTPFLPGLPAADAAVFKRVRPTPVVFRKAERRFQPDRAGIGQLLAVIREHLPGLAGESSLAGAPDSGIFTDPQLRPILELLRPAALAQAAAADPARLPAFPVAGLETELRRVAFRLEKLVKSYGCPDDI